VNEKNSSFTKVPRDLPRSGVVSRPPSILGGRLRNSYKFENPAFRIRMLVLDFRGWDVRVMGET